MGRKVELAAAASALGSLALLIVSGLLGQTHWQLFNLLFAALLVLPLALGSHQSTGTLAMLGDLLEGLLMVSMWAFPTVLLRVNLVTGTGAFLIYLSNVLAALAGFFILRIAQDW
jgi:hypothetical protein